MKVRIRTLAVAAALIASSTLSIGQTSTGTVRGTTAEVMQMCENLSGAQERQDCMQRARSSSKGGAKDSSSGTHSNPSGTSGGKWSGDKSGTTDSSQQDRGSSGNTSGTSSGSKR
jgi:hypothetical protein